MPAQLLFEEDPKRKKVKGNPQHEKYENVRREGRGGREGITKAMIRGKAREEEEEEEQDEEGGGE